MCHAVVGSADLLIRVCLSCVVIRSHRSSSSCYFFFFKQKTAYEMRISDWSSDVCSSDLREADASLSSFEALMKKPIDRRPEAPQDSGPIKIGRASCRERVCQYV